MARNKETRKNTVGRPTFTIEQARKLIRGYTAGGSPEVIETVAAHMVRTGDCVWHASHIVLKTARCWCADCNP